MTEVRVLTIKKVGLIALVITIIILAIGKIVVSNSQAVSANKNISAGKIYTGTPIRESSCFVCHRSLDRTDYPGLYFSHTKHFKKGINCKSCHIEFPHKKNELIKPKMDTCFSCHGVKKEKQKDRVSGKCSLCHPNKDFNLTPKDHTKEWVSSEHKTSSADNQKRCSMCHQEQNFCNDCHKKTNVKLIGLIPFKPAAYLPSEKGLSININGEVTPSKCIPCHNNYDRTKFKTLKFKHNVHFQRKIYCSKCHKSFPHSKSSANKPLTKIPEMRTCFSCHGLSHGKQKVFAPGKCNACHPINFKLKPENHTIKWVRQSPKLHKISAKKDKSQCMMCHSQNFCNSCHKLEPIPHQKQWKDLHGKTVVELARNTNATSNSNVCTNCHKPSTFCGKCHKGVVFPHEQNWRNLHGKQAKSKGKAACLTCHRKSVCNDCHQGVEMPHKPKWLGKHIEFLNDKSPSNCLVCHEKKQCEQCHSTHNVHNQNKIYKYDVFEKLDVLNVP